MGKESYKLVFNLGKWWCMSIGYNIVLFLFLVNNYAAVEGEISIESCRQAAKKIVDTAISFVSFYTKSWIRFRSFIQHIDRQPWW